MSSDVCIDAAVLAEIAAQLRAAGHTVSIGGYITTEAVSDWTGIAARTLRDWRATGVGPSWYDAGGPRYRITDVAAWLEGLRRPGSEHASGKSGGERQK